MSRGHCVNISCLMHSVDVDVQKPPTKFRFADHPCGKRCLSATAGRKRPSKCTSWTRKISNFLECGSSVVLHNILVRDVQYWAVLITLSGPLVYIYCILYRIQIHLNASIFFLPTGECSKGLEAFRFSSNIELFDNIHEISDLTRLGVKWSFKRGTGRPNLPVRPNSLA